MKRYITFMLILFTGVMFTGCGSRNYPEYYTGELDNLLGKGNWEVIFDTEYVVPTGYRTTWFDDAFDVVRREPTSSTAHSWGIGYYNNSGAYKTLDISDEYYLRDGYEHDVSFKACIFIECATYVLSDIDDIMDEVFGNGMISSSATEKELLPLCSYLHLPAADVLGKWDISGLDLTTYSSMDFISSESKLVEGYPTIDVKILDNAMVEQDVVINMIENELIPIIYEVFDNKLHLTVDLKKSDDKGASVVVKSWEI